MWQRLMLCCLADLWNVDERSRSCRSGSSKNISTTWVFISYKTVTDEVTKVSYKTVTDLDYLFSDMSLHLPIPT